MHGMAAFDRNQFNQEVKVIHIGVFLHTLHSASVCVVVLDHGGEGLKWICWAPNPNPDPDPL